MHDLQIGPWTLRCDVEATRRAHAAGIDAALRCGCRECRNFALARDVAYPPEARALLARLGVEPIREAEIFHVCEVAPGAHLYGGWLHVVGELVDGPDARRPVAGGAVRELQLEPLGPGFALGFTRGATLVPDGFPSAPLLQVELQLEVPWLLAEPHVDAFLPQPATIEA